MTIKDESINRKDLLEYLESKGIQTILPFDGNITRQPLFEEYKKGDNLYRVVGKLENTDLITNNTFWVGVYPGITENKINYIALNIEEYIMKIRFLK